MTPIRLHPAEYELEAGAARDAAFVGEEPGALFTDELPARAILMPVYGTLSEPQFDALRRAAAAVDADDDSFYGWSLADGQGGWGFAFSDYDGYAACDDLATFEYVLHSAQGRWALYWMWEWKAAAVAGSEPFLTELLAAWPSAAERGSNVEPQRQAAALVDVVAGISKAVARRDQARAWLASLLTHLYAEPEATRLLAVFDEAP